MNTYYASSLEQLVYQHPDDVNFRFYFKIRSTNLENELRKNYQEGEIYENVVSKLAFVPSNLLANAGLVLGNLFSDEADLETLANSASAWLSTLEGYESDELKDLGSVFTVDVVYYKNGNEYQFSMGDKDFPIFTYTSQSTMEFLVERELLKMDGVGKRNKSQASSPEPKVNSSPSTQTMSTKTNSFYDNSPNTEVIPTIGYKGKEELATVIKSPYVQKPQYLEHFSGEYVAVKGFKVEYNKKGVGEKEGEPSYYFYGQFNEDAWGEKALFKISKSYMQTCLDDGKINPTILEITEKLNKLGSIKTYDKDYLVMKVWDNRERKSTNAKLEFLADFEAKFNEFIVAEPSQANNSLPVPPNPKDFPDDIPSAINPETRAKVGTNIFGAKTKARA